MNAVTGEYEASRTPLGPSPDASADDAGVAAAHGGLTHYMPDRAASLDAARTRSLATIPDGPAKAAGVAIGETSVARLIAARADEGSVEISVVENTP